MVVLQHRDSASDLKYLCFFELSLSEFFKNCLLAPTVLVSTTAHFFASNHRYKSMPNHLNLIRNIF